MIKNITDISDVQVKFVTSFNYTDTIKEMVKDGELTNMKEIKSYLLEILEEDLISYLFESVSIKNCVIMHIK
jgi:hypothetical protein